MREKSYKNCLYWILIVLGFLGSSESALAAPPAGAFPKTVIRGHQVYTLIDEDRFVSYEAGPLGLVFITAYAEADGITKNFYYFRELDTLIERGTLVYTEEYGLVPWVGFSTLFQPSVGVDRGQGEKHLLNLAQAIPVNPRGLKIPIRRSPQLDLAEGSFVEFSVNFDLLKPSTYFSKKAGKVLRVFHDGTLQVEVNEFRGAKNYFIPEWKAGRLTCGAAVAF